MTDLTNRAICRFVLLLIILLLAIAPAQAGQWLAASALSGGENGALDAILARVAPARAGRLAAQYIDFTALDAAFETLTGEVPVDRWSLEAQCVIVRGHSMACFLHHYERARTADSAAPTHRSRA